MGKFDFKTPLDDQTQKNVRTNLKTADKLLDMYRYTQPGWFFTNVYSATELVVFYGVIIFYPLLALLIWPLLREEDKGFLFWPFLGLLIIFLIYNFTRKKRRPNEVELLKKTLTDDYSKTDGVFTMMYKAYQKSDSYRKAREADKPTNQDQ